MNVPTRDQAQPSRLSILWSLARPHWGKLLLGLALALVTSAMGLATPMVTKWVLDALAASTSLAGPIWMLVVLLVVGAVVGLWQWVLLGSLGERVVLDARESMVRRLFRAKVHAVTGRPSGEFVTRVTSDTVLLREAASSSIIGLINGAVMLIGSLILMGVLDLVLLGTTAIAIALVGVLFGMLMPAIAKAQERAQEHVGRLGGMLETALRAVRTVKVSRAEQRQSDRILADARQSAEYGVRAVRQEAVSWTIAGSGLQLAIIVILGLGAWRVSQGHLEVSALIAFLLYAFGLMEPISELTENVTGLQSGIAAAGRIREVNEIDVETDLVETRQGGRGSTPNTGPVLEFSGVTAAYGPDLPPALAEVDLAIPRRGHTAIVGPSGAGKTTMFSLILRFLEPQQGSLRLNGEPYLAHTHNEIRSALAYVEQESPTVPGTIRENLLFTHPDATEAELRAVLEEVRLTDKIAELDEGLDTPLSSTSLSGGQRQRIALARAILRTPQVLLLDEATAQVDALTEGAIHDCIRDRASKGAVVTIAHRLSTVVDADTIVVLDEGRVRAMGTHHELLATDELYASLVAALRLTEAPPVPVASE
ncbi:ABC-type multidrug transport system fused ATPase/permease subunit [Tamaricihabitans halophyticus]|uniref:ABC-type multidrug transport system fused ATPase/permease subunit n=1 Tax=Tamaricihabitans halophyticus TaxID=1262583 RepID=A0A4R2R3Y3_9PSEU|nr:ABC transporter ATP-binding protein [Tamaricihabitans halophyticus]TCP54251.1 ABC-type multidrug transport system fused ATPase/permease subunit [Tamaricihabitans halophyticus]